MTRSLLIGLLIAANFAFAQNGRQVTRLDTDWHFHLGEVAGAEEQGFDHAGWRQLDLPHDWSIEQPYAEENSGRHAFLPGGIGWYRKELAWDDRWAGQQVFLEFDGAFMNSSVWINGKLLGERPYGYISFGYDLTPYLKRGENIVAVRVDNSRLPSARWYTGSGINRPVKLITTGNVHVGRHGTFVRTPVANATNAQVEADITIINRSGVPQMANVVSIVKGPGGKEVAQARQHVTFHGDSTVLNQQFEIIAPQLWSPEHPTVYHLHTSVESEGKITDTYVTPFGIRRIEIGAAFGFKLNGYPLKLQGVCEHESMGPLGAAVPPDALHRKLTLLKEMGCNAIRTGHHPFSTDFYNMCDTMGFLVLNEIFDGWYHWEGFSKAKWDYGHYFLDWWKTDLEEFVKRDRNHPSVVIWSLGNEVWGYEKHLDLQKQINDRFHALDPTRPTTQGWATHTHLDIAGFNANGEGKHDIANFHERQPNKPAVGTEIPHTRQTRGIYRTMTSYNPWDKPDLSGHETSAANKANLFHIPDLTEYEVFTDYDMRYASGYDNQTRKISVRDSWKLVRDNDFYMGDFRWTGFDYIGEAWSWPARTNNYGVIDLAGFPKDTYYLYQSLWTTEPMVHMLPHWNHAGNEGEEIPVVVYTNGNSGELWLNGRSLGRKAVHPDTLQLVWHVPYEPGKLEVVAFKGGQAVARKHVETSGPPARLRLTADRKRMRANRRDLVHITVDVVDQQGRFVPTASGDTVEFQINGPYKLVGVENGDILDMSPQKVTWRKTFMGKALLILQATERKGTIKVLATSAGLAPDNEVIKIKKVK